MPRRLIQVPAVAAALVLAASSAARADTLTLRNGDHLSGKVLHKSGDTLTFETTYAGKLKIRWSEIQSVTTDAPVKFMLKGESSVHSAVLAPGSVELDQVANGVIESWVKFM